MRWRRGYRSDHVEDRRGRGRGAAVAVGGGGLVAALVAVLFAVLGGGGGGAIDLDSIFGQFGQAPPVTAADPNAPDPDEDLRAISNFTLDKVQAMWQELFAASGADYPEATMVLFSGSTPSGCGGASSAVGPHYCPLDQNIYVDLDFFRELERRFGASGDFAQAYVIAHEVAHHVQNVTGIMDEVRSLQQAAGSQAEANEYSVSLELQADCLAGVWARTAFEADLLERGDLEEAIGAAEAVGDDRIQQQAGGMVNPETWTHGSSAQRAEWFTTGYDTGNPNTCDPFA